MEKQVIEVDDQYKRELFEWFYGQLNASFHTTEIRDQLKSAYDFAFEAHKTQFRKTTGEPFIIHPVSVALIVANEIGLGVRTVEAALLHDTIEDNREISRGTIQSLFGEVVADMVEGVTKITNTYDAQRNVQAETFKKMLMSIPHNPRVVFIKIADRLHNMRTMEGMPEGTKHIKAGENLYVYVPVADQLGLYDIKNEIEDASFKYTLPSSYASVVKMVEYESKVLSGVLANFKLDLMRVLINTGFVFKIVTVKKSLHTVWSGLSEGMVFEDTNYETIRVVFKPTTDDEETTVGECYKLYSSIIYNFKEKDGSKHDYLIHPKKNGFCALVFKVYYQGHSMEIQIMTDENEMVAHRGYSRKKPKRTGLSVVTKALEDFDYDEDAEMLVDRFHNLATSQSIMVFTSTGDIYELQNNATVLDFAYTVHTDLGNHCIGAYVGSKFVPLDYHLKTADKVTVFTSPSARPQPKWLDYVITDRAKNKITTYLHRSSSSKNMRDIEAGKIIFNNLLFEHKIIPDIVLLNRIITYFHLSNGDEFYQLIASQEISKETLWTATESIHKTIRESRRRDGIYKIPMPSVIDYGKPIKINKYISFIPASCCHPICGDDAFAFVDNDNLLYVHRRECEDAQRHITMQGKQTTRVEWCDDLDPMLTVMKIQGTDRQGIIRDVSILIDSWRVNIQSFEIGARDNIFTGIVKLMVKNTETLKKLASQLAHIPNIVSVNRISPNSNSGWTTITY